MKIACLGWGSLIWDSRDLLITGEWQSNGPLIPVEFLRKSADGRVTLILDSNVKPIQSLWCLMKTDNLETAKWSLGRREYENANEVWVNRNIGSWNKYDTSPVIIPTLQDWATENEIDAVIWTALPCKHPIYNNETSASMEEVVDYLKSLTGEEYERAKKYILNTPTQIDTDYRRAITKELGW